MSILLNKDKKVLIQGITGREGMARVKLMQEYGTRLVAGCTPGKGGSDVNSIPVYDTVKEVIDKHGKVDISVLFIPAPSVKEAAFEAIDNGIKFIVIVPDKVPIYDVMAIAEYGRENQVTFLGPNTLGILTPDEAVCGMIGGNASAAKSWFKKGPVGITSRSGGITTSLAYYLNKEGIGQTTIVHVGGDPIIGLTHPEIVELFEKDEETKLIVMFGEIGTSQEEQVADLIKTGKVKKPLIAYIGGKGAKEGTRYSHAGAIVEGNSGKRETKVKALLEAGAYVVENYDEVPKITKEVINKLGIK